MQNGLVKLSVLVTPSWLELESWHCLLENVHPPTKCHMSCVTCQMSGVMCQVSHVFFPFFSSFFGQSGRANWWMVCYNTVQMFEPFQIGTKTEVLCLAPGPIWVQQSFLETSPSTFLRCASNETLVKAIALMVPELQLFKETKQGKNCKIKCEFSACSKRWPHSTQNTWRLSTFGNFPCIHMHVN